MNHTCDCRQYYLADHIHQMMDRIKDQPVKLVTLKHAEYLTALAANVLLGYLACRDLRIEIVESNPTRVFPPLLEIAINEN